MNIYLYPAPNKQSRFFDEYYSALLQENDSEISVKILEPSSKLGKRFFSFIGSRLNRKFPKLLTVAMNYLLRHDKAGVVHFMTQLAVQPDIKNRFIFTYHDVFHMQPQFTGRFFDNKTLERIDLAYKRAEFIITVSEVSRSILRLYYPYDKEILIVNPLVPQFVYNQNATILPRDKNHILFIGSSHPRKNLLTFLESIALLKDRHLKVSIVCSLSNGIYKETFEYIIKKLNLQNITIYERIPTEHLDELYNTATVLVFPTFAEGFGAPPAEAQAHGLPVIASDIPICHEVLGESCIYFNPLSSWDLAEKIRMILDDKDEFVTSELIAKGKQNVVKYSLNTVLDAQFAAYKKLLCK